MPKKDRIRIVITDDHSLVRSCLRTALAGQRSLEVVGEAADGREAVALAADLKPDLILMDIAMPNLNGIDAAHQINHSCAGPNGRGNGNGNGNGHGNGHPPRILALSMHRRSSYIQEMLNAGASGYLLKTCSLEDLITGIHTVAAGHTFLAPDVTRIVVSSYITGNNGGQQIIELTRREREVLQLVAEGLASKNIAENLSVSVKTVESHRQRLMKKLEIFSVAGLTKYALREGLTTLNG
jgi:DNA-binding NarL/FixJ family response regulator